MEKKSREKKVGVAGKPRVKPPDAAKVIMKYTAKEIYHAMFEARALMYTPTTNPESRIIMDQLVKLAYVAANPKLAKVIV